MPPNRKRKLVLDAEPTTDSSPPASNKRQKLENQQRHRTPSSFWDDLSRLWLTSRSLREFDRRTEWPATPVPLERTGKEEYIDLVQLKRFARQGGPSLDHLRAYPEPESAAPSNRVMSAGQSGSRKRAKTGSESGISSSPRHTSAYDPGFEQHLIDNGIHMNNRAAKPSNWAEIKNRMAQPRPSLSPSRFSESAFEAFQKINEEALTENEVMSKVFPIIAGTAAIPSKENLLFGNLKDLTNGSITKAQPDSYDGSRPADVHKDVREKLGPYIVPSTNTAAPCLPNFFTEVKGPDGNTAVCNRQAIYDGALGARGVHELRSYINSEMTYDNNAYTITSTYHPSGVLTMRTAHPTVSENPADRTEYRMTQLNGWYMIGNSDNFREGAGALRNARDWAKEKRDELIAAANSKVQDTERSDLVSSTQSFSSLSNEPTHLESDSSADELALDVNTVAGTARRTPVRVQKNTPFKASAT